MRWVVYIFGPFLLHWMGSSYVSGVVAKARAGPGNANLDDLYHLLTFEIIEARLKFQLDMNGDGRFTISDTWLWAKWAFFLPGDIALLLLEAYVPRVATFLELSAHHMGGWIAALLSLLFWWAFWAICKEA